MKKMFVGLAACALIFTGCSKNEILENTSPSNAIQFSKLNSIFTKVANDDLSNYRVFAAWSASSKAWYINSFVLVRNNSYSPQKYWPGEGTVDFYAYAPDATPNFDIHDTPATAVGGVYTVSADAQEDFTIATPIKGQSSGSAALIFNHMLSKITMTVGFPNSGVLSDYEIVSSSAKFILDYNAATFDVMSAKMGAYSGIADAHEYVLIPDLLHVGDVRFLNILPQPANNSGNLELTVTIKDKATGVNVITDRKLATIPLASITALTKGQLEPGKWYQFSITITPSSTDDNGDILFNEISISADVSTWAPGINTPVEQP